MIPARRPQAALLRLVRELGYVSKASGLKHDHRDTFHEARPAFEIGAVPVEGWRGPHGPRRDRMDPESEARILAHVLEQRGARARARVARARRPWR